MTALITLTGCSKNLLDLKPNEIVVNETPQIVLPAPAPVKLNKLKWHVTVDKETGIVYFSLSTGDYENLSLNMAELLRWIQEANWQLKYYTDQRSEEDVTE